MMETIGIYLLILIAKIAENMLGTLRMIIISNGMKHIGAILAFMISVIWVATIGITVIDIQKDFFRVVIFAIGTYLGSYAGSLLEEKIAIGNNLLLVITNVRSGLIITKKLRSENYAVTVIKADGKQDEKQVLVIFAARKKLKLIIKRIKEIDNNAMIVSESANVMLGGYHANVKH